MEKKNWHTGLAVAAFLVLFFLTGVLSILLTEKFGWKLDLTENKLYTLSSETEKILSDLKEQVTITVFNEETEYPLLPKNLLAGYPQKSRNITVRYCDPYREPKLVRLYEDKGCSIELNDLIIESNGRYQQLKLMDLYQLDNSQSQVEKLYAEQEITSGIHKVVNKEKKKVLFTDGHGEEPSMGLMDIFSQNHYQTAYTELSIQGIDKSTELLVICSPKRDFSSEEIYAVEKYLENGKSVMLFWEPGSSGMTNLREFLEDWGISPTDELVEEPDLYVSGSRLNVAATYVPHEINQFFSNNRYYVITPSCVAMKQVYEKQGTTETSRVLRSSAKAVTERLGEKGPFALVLSSERRVTVQDGNEAVGKLFVCGSKNIYGDDLLSSEKLANRDFLIQAAAWCTEDGTMINIPPKEMGHELLPVVAAERRKWAVLMLVVLPVGILAMGVGISFHRRYL